jgi:phenylalanyl-tRNA synthetase beta chain
VLDYLVKLIIDVAGGAPASETFDRYEALPQTRMASVTPAFINERLGLELEKSDIETLLSNVEFGITNSDDETVHYTVPFWRTDIELPEDVVEEVGRLYGFDRLPRELPRRTIRPATVAPSQQLDDTVRSKLAAVGGNEILTYSFIHEKLMSRAGQDSAHAYRLSNALSPDLQYYRLGMTPSLLDKVHLNVKAGYDAFALYELGKVHFKNDMDTAEPTLPNEDRRIALIVSRKKANAGAAFYDARRYLNEVIDLAVDPLLPMKDFDMTTDLRAQQLTAPYDAERSAVIVRAGKLCGVVGEFRPEVRRAFKLPEHTAGFEIRRDLLRTDSAAYRPLSRFPSVSQDVSIRSDGANFAQVESALRQVIAALPESLSVAVTPIDIYRPAAGNEVTMTLNLQVTSQLVTLTAGDVRPIVEAIDSAAEQAFSGRVI